jgi:hypothetical protein
LCFSHKANPNRRFDDRQYAGVKQSSLDVATGDRDFQTPKRNFVVRFPVSDRVGMQSGGVSQVCLVPAE